VVTGAGGFIGQRLVRLLQAQGHAVIGVGRTRASGVDEVIDLARPQAIDRLLDDTTTLFHLAGSADVRRSVTEPMFDFAANVVASINVLESARSAGCRFIFASTGSVYEARSCLPLSEVAPVRPRSPYAAAKLSVEAYCHAYHASYGVDALVARIFSVFGPGMKQFAIRDFVERLECNPRVLVIRGDGRQIRDYLYVDDAARALYVIAAKGKAGEIYNVASGHGRNIREVAESVRAAMGLHNCEVTVDGQSYGGEPHWMQADVTKLREIGFFPSTTFEQALATTVTSLRNKRRCS
jgi:nucleoside-diphosphate-sugar epimerase